ncbi:MAG: GNAT family N-acetyltransferase [Clostridia bacterium]|nr:GNAT family N-acetyltransferase [Clostridia bacterium]
MLEKRWATPEDRNDIIDFIDYIFSKAHRPHDFATLLPKLYGGDADTTPHHFIIKEDGKILAAILAYPVKMTIAGEELMTIGVGSVSTHPRARGRGFMDDLLAAVDAHAKELDASFAVLGGDRQRYGYYGFDLAGCQLVSSLGTHNARHAFKAADTTGLSLVPMQQAHVPFAARLHAAQPSFCERSEETFVTILKNWSNNPMAILRGGQMIGYCVINPISGGQFVSELLLKKEEDCPAVLRLMSETYGNLSILTPPWHKERVALLTGVCQTFSLTPNHMMKFYQPERVKAALHKLGANGDSLHFDGLTPPLPLYVAPADGV